MRVRPSWARTSSSALAVVVAAAGVVSACGGTSARAHGRRPDAGVVVVVAGFAFKPDTASVRVGQTVTWQFRQPDAPHNVVSLTGPGSFDSGSPQGSGSFAHAFAAAGTYTYWCQVHPFMRAKIVVTP